MSQIHACPAWGMYVSDPEAHGHCGPWRCEIPRPAPNSVTVEWCKTHMSRKGEDVCQFVMIDHIWQYDWIEECVFVKATVTMEATAA